MFLRIGETASLLGVAVITLRRWDRAGVFGPSWRSPGNHRRYEMRKIRAFLGEATERPDENLTVGYARVSSFDQKDDLERQALRLANVVKIERNHEVIKDLGSGLNFKKKGLSRLISLILSGKVRRLIVTHRDRLLRFGFEIIDKMVRHFGGEIVVLDEVKISDEDELSRDVLSIITVFSARLYGKRSHKNKKLLAAGELLVKI